MTDIKLLSLDMAGTTIDEDGTVYAVLESTCRALLGKEIPTHILAGWKGTSKKEAIAGIARDLDAPLNSEQLNAAYAQFKQELIAAYAATPPRAIPGVAEALQSARQRGVKVALQTGYDRDVAESILDAVGWVIGSGEGSHVDALVTSDQVTASRPAPYLIFKTMEATGVMDVAEVLVAGDTANDLAAGKNAGVAIVVGVLSGAYTREHVEAGQPTHVLESLAAVGELLDSLRKLDLPA